MLRMEDDDGDTVEKITWRHSKGNVRRKVNVKEKMFLLTEL